MFLVLVLFGFFWSQVELIVAILVYFASNYTQSDQFKLFCHFIGEGVSLLPYEIFFSQWSCISFGNSLNGHIFAQEFCFKGFWGLF